MNLLPTLRLRSTLPSTAGALRCLTVGGLTALWNSPVWAQGVTGAGANQTSGARGSGASAPLGAPEINPALIWGAVILLVGGVLILTSRRRRATSTPNS